MSVVILPGLALSIHGGHLHQAEAKAYDNANLLPTVHVQSPNRLERECKDQEVSKNC